MNSIRTLLDTLTLLESAVQVVAYHGSAEPIDAIRLYHGAVYFTSEPDVAKSYGDVVAKYQLTLSNPAIVYTNNENWDTIGMNTEIKVAGKEITVYELFNGEIAENELLEASSIAYELHQVYAVDSVILKDVIDTGANTETYMDSDVYVLFNVAQARKI
jgi:hypothetical protein